MTEGGQPPFRKILGMSGYVPILPITDEQVIETMRAEIYKSELSGPRRAIEKLIVAALSSIP